MSTPQSATHDRATYANVPADLDAALANLQVQNVIARIWQKDHTVWRPDPTEISNRLGWLTEADQLLEKIEDLVAFANQVRGAGFTDVVLLGMGGSSLAPELLRNTFRKKKGYLRLHVLDSTVPAWVRRVARSIKPERTLFIVSSKSGTTLEPKVFFEYFYVLVKEAKGAQAGENFIAITDPGTPLQALGEEHHFRRVFLNNPDIGGRYSAQSYFGMVPAALAGVDVRELLMRTAAMAAACDGAVPVHENPGARLGVALGTLAQQGRDKVTFISSPDIASFGLWVEQLLAESTGKEGKGILPIALEPFAPPDVYGPDRVFAYLRLDNDHNGEADRHADALEATGQPVIRCRLRDLYDIGGEWIRWEFATAVAGSLLGINAFDQPNVQESKDNTNRVLHSSDGQFPDTGTTGSLSALLAEAKPGDYVALMAYVEQTPAMDAAFQKLRKAILERHRLPNTMGYGPRFLHSTGQYHKGGPPTGLFVQLVADWGQDVPIPGEPFTFAKLAAAQVVGDYQSLESHQRRVIRIHVGKRAATMVSRLAKDV